MSEDLISRQAAIEAVQHTIYEFFDVVEDDDESPMTYKDTKLLELNKSISTRIKDLPTAESRWIPCSERLPERGVSVLLSHVGYVSEDYLDFDDGAMFFWNSGIDLDEELNNLAWMPLPEPWKGEEDE